MWILPREGDVAVYSMLASKHLRYMTASCFCRREKRARRFRLGPLIGLLTPQNLMKLIYIA